MIHYIPVSDRQSASGELWHRYIIGWVWFSLIGYFTCYGIANAGASCVLGFFTIIGMILGGGFVSKGGD